MKNHALFLLLLLPLFLSANNRPDYAVFLIDSALIAESNAVIRSYTSSFNVHSPGEATHTVKMVVTRLNENAAYEDLAVYYNMYSKVGKITATLYDAFGNEVRKFKKNEIKDVSAVSGGTMYGDSRIKYLDLEYGDYPYTIEYEYETDTKSIFSYPVWEVQNFRTSVASSSYELLVPNDISIDSRLFNLDEATFIANQVEGKNKYLWQAKNIAAVKREYNSPEPHKQLAFGLFVPSKFAVGDYEGSMASWEDFGNFMNDINAGRDVLSSTMKSKVQELTKNAATDEEKIAILYRYMQDNMRYVSVQLGIGGWQTFDAQYVEENKFGDCKALSNFMKAMLKAVDIPAYHTLVYAGDEIPYQVSENFSYPRFNHMILHVPSTDTWLECTSNLDPPNYLGTFTDDRNVLLITEEGGKFARTPAIDEKINWEKNKFNITLDTKGGATINRLSTMSGVVQEGYRAAKHHLSSEELEKRLLQNSDLPMSDMENLQLNVSKDRPEVALQYDLKVARYASKGGKRLFIPIHQINAFNKLPDTQDDRQHAYEIRHSYTEQDTVVLQLPAQAKIESMPKAVNIQTEYGSLTMTYQTKGQQLIAIRTLEINALDIPATAYESYRNFLKQIIKADKAKLVVVINQA